MLLWNAAWLFLVGHFSDECFVVSCACCCTEWLISDCSRCCWSVIGVFRLFQVLWRSVYEFFDGCDGLCVSASLVYKLHRTVLGAKDNLKNDWLASWQCWYSSSRMCAGDVVGCTVWWFECLHARFEEEHRIISVIMWCIKSMLQRDAKGRRVEGGGNEAGNREAGSQPSNTG
jgi:hypothetical protein